MTAPVRFLVEVVSPGHLKARGVDTEIEVEARTLAELDRQVRDAIARLVDARRPVHLLLGGRWQLRPQAG